MKVLVLLFTMLLGFNAYSTEVNCILAADGPDYVIENEYSYNVDTEKYFFEEQEVNEFIYSAVTFTVEKDSVDIELILTDEDDYAGEEYFSLDLGKSSLIQGSYFLEDKEYEYTLLCSYEK